MTWKIKPPRSPTELIKHDGRVVGNWSGTLDINITDQEFADILNNGYRITFELNLNCVEGCMHNLEKESASITPKSGGGIMLDLIDWSEM